MVQLVPMTETDYQTYIEALISDYAEEHVRAGNWHPAEALEKSRQQVQQLLPNGLATKNQYLFSIEDETAGAKVGMIWLAVYEASAQPFAFIYDLMIRPDARRKGYATQALLALEEKVKELGLNKIALHVFAHNRAAQDLYEKVGYAATDINMAKMLN